VANAGEKLEFILVSLVPPEFDSLITVVYKLECSRFALVYNAVSNDHLIFKPIWETFKCHIFTITFPNEKHLMLLEGVVLSIECKKEFFYLSCFWSKTNVESLI
jgi:hypothetical protein